MAGTKIGGMKAREANYRRHGKDFYKKIGAIGGKNGHTGGFAANPELARRAGSKGGRISKRGAESVRLKKIEPQKKKIQDLYAYGYTVPQISEKLDIPYTSLLKWVKENIPNYGAKYNIYE